MPQTKTNDISPGFAKRKKSKMGKRSVTVFIILMISVPMIKWLVFWLGVNLTSFAYAFRDVRGNWTLVNFQDFFKSLSTAGAELNISLKNTLIYFLIGVGITTPSGFFVAYFLFKRIMGRAVFRVMFYLPGIISVVVLTMVFKQFIMPFGPLDGVLRSLSIGKIPPSGLLGQTVTATKTIVFYCIWTGFGGSFMILGGAMSRIPLDVLESARLDGCGAFREAVQLILPLVWPTLATLLVFTMTGIFNASGPVLTLVTGDYGTSTISFWIFNKVNGDAATGRGGGQYNIVSATGLLFTLILVPVILLCRKLVEKVPDVEY